MKIAFLISLIFSFNTIIFSQVDRDIGEKIGIVDSNGKCFQTRNANLKPDNSISIIWLNRSSQKVLKAVVEGKLDKSCSRSADAGDGSGEMIHYYSLKLNDKNTDNFPGIFGLGIINPNENIRVKNKLASFDINGDEKLEFFRSCTSSEGVHLTIWKGKPLQGKRIWHAYYYLGYDTEPNCKKKDYEGTDN